MVPELRRTAVRELVLVREPLVVPELEAVLDGGLEDGLRDTVPEGLSPDPDPDRVAAARCPKAGGPARTRPQVMVASIRIATPEPTTARLNSIWVNAIAP